ncbi:MAG: hypothetical protein JWL68_3320, partial [Actinomycetia bacterium]|nr:hypothetical protein [Actinomycetes bacterium]
DDEERDEASPARALLPLMTVVWLPTVLRIPG